MIEETKVFESTSDATMNKLNLKSIPIPNSSQHIIQPEFYAYKIAIENLAKNNSQSTFGNSGPEHAAIVMGNIFKNATKHIKLFAKDFNGAVSDNPYYLESLKLYLETEKPLTIIFEDEPNPNSKALALIRSFNSNRVAIRKIKNGVKLKKEDNFAISDDRMFRLEYSKDDYKAVCSYNNPDFVRILEDIYTDLINQSKVYQN